MSELKQPAVSLGRPDYTALEFGPPLEDRPYVVANMVSAADGKVVVEGTERGLGTPDDQALMRELRFHADVVMNGAGTLRASGTSSRVPEGLQERRIAAGKPANPLGAVVTSTGELPLDRAFFTARDFEAMVYASEAAGASRLEALRATGRAVVVMPSGGGIAWVLRHMRRELSASLLLVEGGPSLNGELFDGGLIDELFLTVGSVVVGGDGTKTAVQSERPPALDALTHLDLVSAAVNAATSEVYLRYRVGGRGAAR